MPSKAATLSLTAAGVVASALVLRFLKRRLFSPVIECRLSCPCGQIQGTIQARWEDSMCINCYCQDCRTFAKFVAKASDKYCGDDCMRVVQVCKNALKIEKGMDKIQLARKGSAEQSKQSGQVYMHRYYAKCCHVPLYNTVDFLGFVGVYRDYLSSTVSKYDGPVRMYVNEALPGTVSTEPDVFAPAFLWKLLRYYPWSKAGPFDYDQQPECWGEEPIPKKYK